MKSDCQVGVANDFVSFLLVKVVPATKMSPPTVFLMACTVELATSVAAAASMVALRPRTKAVCRCAFRCATLRLDMQPDEKGVCMTCREVWQTGRGVLFATGPVCVTIVVITVELIRATIRASKRGAVWSTILRTHMTHFAIEF